MSSKPLWDHQKKAIERAKNLPDYALLFEPGLGKTRTAIEILRHRVNTEGRMLRTLIVSPLITLHNWKSELLEFTKIPPENILILQGSGKQREKLLAGALFGGSPGKVVIVNYEALSTMPAVHKLLLTWKPDLVIADEMHKLKNPTSKRATALRQISNLARYRLGLTGTALLNSPLDIFGQWFFLDQGKIFGPSYYAFKNRFFVDKNAKMPKHVHFPKLEAKPDTLDRIKAMIQPISSSAIKSECLDLPPLVKQRFELEMTPEMAKHYKSMKQDFITWVKEADATVVASTALVKLLRLMQLTSGFMKTDQGDELPLKTNPKEDALEDLLEQILPNKVIIWAVFKRNYESIKKVCGKLGVSFVECHGAVPNAKKFEAVEAFNRDPSVKVFIGHPQSLGIGINLVAASHMVYFSRSFSLGDDVQSEARNYRAGSEIHEKITRYDLVMKDTVDELCMAALAAKAEMSGALVRNWIEKNLI